MTLEEVKEKYKHAAKVTCSYHNELPKAKRKIYEPVLSTIRASNSSNNEFVCNDVDGSTPYIGLWHYHRGFAEIVETQKVIDNSNEKTDTFLDKQLLEYKKK